MTEGNNLASETELANAVFWYHRFYLRFAEVLYRDITREKIGEVSDAITPPAMRLRLDAALGVESEPEPERGDWYVWATTELGVRDKPYWGELDIAGRELIAMHGMADKDGIPYSGDPRDLVEPLVVAIEGAIHVRWFIDQHPQ